MTDYKNIRDRSYRQEELSSRFPNISEEEKFHKEVLGEIAVWHTPKEVYEVYQRHHQRGETIEAILVKIKSSETRQKEAVSRQNEIIGELSNLQKQSEENRKEFDKNYREIGKGISRIDFELGEASKILTGEHFSLLIYYDKDGVKITEGGMKKIFEEYFRGTNLEDVSYNWLEILNPEYLKDIADIFKMIAKKKAEKREVIELLNSVSTKLANSIGSVQETNRKKFQRALKENDIRIWVLSVGVNKLRRDIITYPKRVAINYRIDKGESAPVLTEINHRVNRQFGTRFTPID